MKQKGTVHERRMLVALPIKKLVGELRMQAFVMAHDTIAQSPKTGDDGQDNKYQVDRFFPIQVN